MKSNNERIIELAEAIVLETLKKDRLMDMALNHKAACEKWPTGKLEAELDSRLAALVSKSVAEARRTVDLINQALNGPAVEADAIDRFVHKQKETAIAP